jgi:hypothetical protein
MSSKSDFNRSLSRIFTNPVFKEITQSGSSDFLLEKLKKYNKLLSVDPGMQVKDIIENAYGYLSKNYRNEYLYKNTILNNILLGRHSVRTATMLNELKIGNSIADIVIINGTSTVYEIKTELDSPDKLQKQLQDYKKAFTKIYIVTHHSLSQKYLSLLEGTSAGLLSLNGRFNLTELKESEKDTSSLCNVTMMRILRKEEYSSIVRGLIGCLPVVSNIKFFSECLKVVSSVDPEELQEMILQELKKRTPQEAQALECAELPKELKHICLCINPTQKEYNNLYTFLNHNL